MRQTRDAIRSWDQHLSETLRESLRLAFVGVGQELRGDDAAGVLTVRRLRQAVSDRSGTRLYFEAGPLPEASAGPLRRFRPDWVVFLDAADMGAAPGTIRWIEPDQIESGLTSTHTFPMGGFAEYLSAELGCRVAVLGIQPEQMEFDAPVSAQVRRSIEELATRILEAEKSPE
jgi:hydrogenase 3 maturation protease